MKTRNNSPRNQFLGPKAKKYRLVSGAPGDEKIVHPGGRKNIALFMTKFISDISSPWERQYHLRKDKNWLLMERKAQKLHRKKKIN